MTNSKKITILCDGFRVNGPKVDGGYTISFNVGEYERDKVAMIISAFKDEVIELTVGGIDDN